MVKEKSIGDKRYSTTIEIKSKGEKMRTRARAGRIVREIGQLSKGYHRLVFLSIGSEREGSIKIHILLH